MVTKLKKTRKGNSSDSVGRKRTSPDMRTKATIQRLKMYKSGGLKHDRRGKIIGGFLRSMNKSANQDLGKAARIQPDRRWFGNTRVIGQAELDKFREEMTTVINNPYSVILRTKQLPLSLIKESTKIPQVDLISAESYEDTFGPKTKRKKPNLKVSSLSELMSTIEKSTNEYDNRGNDSNIKELPEYRNQSKDLVFSKGQSKRIWEELYKVLDSSDVIMQVLDARDPLGTRSSHIEQYLKKNCPTKHLILLLNKVDLIPTNITDKWLYLLSREYPTIAFKSNIRNNYGKNNLLKLLRQYSLLHSDKQQISVGLIGYPNVGKSSVINTLKMSKVCSVAPVPGETKVWQYVTLYKNIYLIDSPGVVYNNSDSEVESVLKGVVRAEKLPNPEEYIDEILKRVKHEYLVNTYKIETWDNAEDFITKMANKSGRLLKGGDPDIFQVSVMIINDFQRGKLPYFVPPPSDHQDNVEGDIDNGEAKIDLPDKESKDIANEEVDTVDEM